METVKKPVEKKRGRPKANKEVVNHVQEEKDAQAKVDVLKQEPKATETKHVETAPMSPEKAVLESRKLLDMPLPAGQRLFETPDGEIILGDETRDRAWSRHMNNGKGGWCNPKR
jgi:hypothetical protein